MVFLSGSESGRYSAAVKLFLQLSTDNPTRNSPLVLNLERG